MHTHSHLSTSPSGRRDDSTVIRPSSTFARVARVARVAALAAPLFFGAACKDFLTGGELSVDPNRVTKANAQLLFTATQPALWVQLGSDLARFSTMFARQMAGVQRQYQVIYQYGISESTTGGFWDNLYSPGGLVDLRNLQALSRESKDSLMLGIARVEEAMMMSTGVDIFGDIVYTKALTGPNPKLDPQLSVYDSLNSLLDRAIVNLRSTGAFNAGPGANDLVYAGSAAKWRQLAYTMKARLYLHTAKVRPGAYALAGAASDSGIVAASGDYVAKFSGNAGEQNLWYQFDVVQRSGYIAPDPYFVTFLTTRPDPVTGTARNDPRVDIYFVADRSDLKPAWMGQPSGGGAPQLLITAAENLLIGAESYYRTGNTAKALDLLNKERTTYQFPASIAPSGYTVPAYAAGTTGLPLLQAILDEKYVVTFGSIEVWNDYKRNCYPNVPAVPSATGKVPARLFYDASERNTNTNIPLPSAQPVRNANDPKSTTDPFGNACIGQ